MTPTNIKNLTLGIIGSLALGALGLVGCGGDSLNSGRAQQDNDVTTVTPDPVAPPAIRPPVKYNFYVPKDEDGLKKDTNYGYLIAKTKPDFKQAMFERLGMEVKNTFTANGATYWYLYKESGVFDAWKAAGTIAGLHYIEPDLMLQHHALEIKPIKYDNPDPYVLSRQWGVHATKTKEAWETYGFGPNKPVVVDVDSGVRFNHEDLSSVVRHAWSWYADNGMDLRSGQTEKPEDEIGPYDYKASGTKTNTDEDYTLLGLLTVSEGGHGTHTAGTIAAVGNNGKGVAGMCWNVDLVSYKGMTNAGSGGSFPVYGSIWHLAKWKNEVVGTDDDGKPIRRYPHTIPVNMSLGSLFANQFASDMIEYGIENGIVVCASSGNSAMRLHNYPASFAGVICVGATDGGDRRAYFSNWGPHVSVVAPGFNIYSVGQPNASAYTDMAGTSMSCPHVTGLVAYMLTFAPDLRPDQIKTYLERNADKVAGKTGFSDEYGHGRINTLKTIKAVIDDVNAGTAPASDYINKRVKVSCVNRTAAGVVSPLNNVAVYLYSCDADGKIINYVASAFSGPSYTTYDRQNKGPVEEGVAYFNLLRPGRYVAKGYLQFANIIDEVWETELASTDTFVVGPSDEDDAVEASMESNREFLHIQTHPQSDTARNTADTVIDIYNSLTGASLYTADSTTYDTMTLLLPLPAGTYYVKVAPYKAPNLVILGIVLSYKYLNGDYALCVTQNPNLMPKPAPGTYANYGPNGYQGSLSTSRATAQAIERDRFYYGRLNDTGPNASSVPNGNWYKFDLQ